MRRLTVNPRCSTYAASHVQRIADVECKMFQSSWKHNPFRNHAWQTKLTTTEHGTDAGLCVSSAELSIRMLRQSFAECWKQMHLRKVESTATSFSQVQCPTTAHITETRAENPIITFVPIPQSTSALTARPTAGRLAT